MSGHSPNCPVIACGSFSPCTCGAADRTHSPSQDQRGTARLSQSSTDAVGEMVAEATRLIRSVHGNDQVPGIPYPIPTMREVDCARTLRKLLDLLTRLQEDKARLEGELKRGAEWAQVFGPGREESWKVDADREKARADKAEAERDTWQRLAIEHKARAERAEAERDALKADMAVAIGLLETPDRLRDMAKISVGGARNRMTAEADDIERLTAKYVDLHATLAGDRTDG